MTNIVLGLALQMSWETMEPWVVSLRRSGYEGDVVLWILPGTPQDILDHFTEFNIKTEVLPNLSFANPETPKGSYFPYVGRFLLAYRYLTEHVEYDNVLLSDVRDAVFMRDPFKEIWFDACYQFYPKQDFIIAAGENMLHRDQPGNMAWLTKSFREVQDFIKHKEIMCSGIIAGTRRGVSELALSIYLMGRDLSAKVWGVDQPVYNFLIHGAFRHLVIKPAMKDGWCLNLAAPALDHNFNNLIDTSIFEVIATPEQEAETGFPAGMRLDTSKFAIVHQYDRIPSLAETYRKYFKA